MGGFGMMIENFLGGGKKGPKYFFLKGVFDGKNYSGFLVQGKPLKTGGGKAFFKFFALGGEKIFGMGGTAEIKKPPGRGHQD